MIIQAPPQFTFLYDGMRINVFHVNKSEGIASHQHTYNHATVCHVGKCVVRVKGKEIIMTKETQPLDLPANISHEIEALEDGTVFVNMFAES